MSRKGWIVRFGTTDSTQARSSIRQSHDGKAWRAVCWLADGVRYAVPIPFATQRDCENCAAVLRKHMPQPEALSLGEFRERFAAIAGGLQETADHLVAACCAW